MIKVIRDRLQIILLVSPSPPFKALAKYTNCSTLKHHVLRTTEPLPIPPRYPLERPARIRACHAPDDETAGTGAEGQRDNGCEPSRRAKPCLALKRFIVGQGLARCGLVFLYALPHLHPLLTPDETPASTTPAMLLNPRPCSGLVSSNIPLKSLSHHHHIPRRVITAAGTGRPFSPHLKEPVVRAELLRPRLPQRCPTCAIIIPVPFRRSQEYAFCESGAAVSITRHNRTFSPTLNYMYLARRLSSQNEYFANGSIERPPLPRSPEIVVS